MDILMFKLKRLCEEHKWDDDGDSFPARGNSDSYQSTEGTNKCEYD